MHSFIHSVTISLADQWMVFGWWTPELVFENRLDEVNAKGTMTDGQTAYLVKHAVGKHSVLPLYGLTTLSDEQAESLGKVISLWLPGLTSITDTQAESLSKVGTIYLTGLTSITDAQAESLSEVNEVRSTLDNHHWRTGGELG